MKRLIFCFDGTWNRLDAPNPTNVVLIAQSICPVAKDGKTQIIHYDQGVGTEKEDKWRGGLFGQGLMRTIANAYRFLIFNYDVGDEIYIFGFSRGAYSARSFAGLLRNCGILRRADAPKITEAIRRYQSRDPHDAPKAQALRHFRARYSPEVCVDAEDDAWRSANWPGYVSGQSPVLRIRYLGVWDTVGSLGVPKSLVFAPFINRKFRFHDCDLSAMVTSARHAVAIDERLESFAPTLWDNLDDDLNPKLGYAPRAKDAPYQQQWFPGGHGSVGGGGDERRLSDAALDWVLSGARNMGLELDTTESSRVFGLQPDYRAPLANIRRKPGFNPIGLFMSMFLPKRDRDPGPRHVEEVSDVARARWAADPADLPDGKPYRPRTLKHVEAELDASAAPVLPPRPAQPSTDTPAPQPAGGPSTFYTVKRGDSLGAIAKQCYGAAARSREIFEANRRILTDPDHIYVGQVLQIPQPAPAEAPQAKAAEPA